VADKCSGIFIVRNDGKVLTCKVSGQKNQWTIPKGKVEKGETLWEGAVRETYEESNIDVSGVTNKYELEKQRYTHRKKVLHPFIVFEQENPELELSKVTLLCNSIVPMDASWNAGNPEISGYAWVELDEAKRRLHYSQANCIERIKNILNSIND
jgi:ADP-ribose pyrophosphatase YjhB (NUDIX family)